MTWLYVLTLCGVALARRSPEENVGDPNLFEGDMILEPEQRMAIELGQDVRAATNNRKHIWPKGMVPFVIDSSLSRQSRATKAIRQGMADWRKKTCIRFKKRKNEKDYVNFKLGSGCSSFVGKRGGKQDINLASGCWVKGIVSHEIGHAVGFYHEQSRPDRDKYVEILFQNIQENAKFNFDKIKSINSLKRPYDYGSVMHYGPKFFSKNGKPTIKKLKKGPKIGQRKGLSKEDAKQANLLYKKFKQC